MDGVNNGQYIGGHFVAQSQMTEYSRKMTLFNLARGLYISDIDKPINVDDVIASARKLELYFLGN